MGDGCLMVDSDKRPAKLLGFVSGSSASHSSGRGGRGCASENSGIHEGWSEPTTSTQGSSGAVHKDRDTTILWMRGTKVGKLAQAGVSIPTK